MAHCRTLLVVVGLFHLGTVVLNSQAALAEQQEDHNSSSSTDSTPKASPVVKTPDTKVDKQQVLNNMKDQLKKLAKPDLQKLTGQVVQIQKLSPEVFSNFVDTIKASDEVKESLKKDFAKLGDGSDGEVRSLLVDVLVSLTGAPPGTPEKTEEQKLAEALEAALKDREKKEKELDDKVQKQLDDFAKASDKAAKDALDAQNKLLADADDDKNDNLDAGLGDNAQAATETPTDSGSGSGSGSPSGSGSGGGDKSSPSTPESNKDSKSSSSNPLANASSSKKDSDSTSDYEPYRPAKKESKPEEKTAQAETTPSVPSSSDADFGNGGGFTPSFEPAQGGSVLDPIARGTTNEPFQASFTPGGAGISVNSAIPLPQGDDSVFQNLGRAVFLGKEDKGIYTYDDRVKAKDYGASSSPIVTESFEVGGNADDKPRAVAAVQVTTSSAPSTKFGVFSKSPLQTVCGSQDVKVWVCPKSGDQEINPRALLSLKAKEALAR